MTDTTHDIAGLVAFLGGSGHLDGVWFGDRHPTGKGAFWWRRHLHLITALQAERDAWKARAEAAEENVGILQASREALEAQVAQLQRELAKARGLGPRAKAEARVAELELLAKGQEEQLEIQGNALIRMNNRATEQTARAEAAEAALTREPYIVKIGPYHGICIGGRWDNWMFYMSANGQWVSQQKLSTAPLTPPADLAKEVADE